MRTSGLFETTRYEFKLASSKAPIFLVFLSDIHWLNPEFSVKAWANFKQWAKENGAHAHYLLNGDYLEWANARTRQAIVGTMMEEYQQQIDRWVSPDLKEFAEEIEFTRGRIIGIGEGNHGWRFEDGTNDSQMLSGIMRAPFLGVSSVSQVTINYHGRFAAFQIYMHHGRSSLTTTTGGPINTVEKLVRHVDGVLIYAMGDNHQRWAVPTDPKLTFRTNAKTHKLEPYAIEPWLIRTGGFVKNYEPGTKSYVVDKGLGPRSLGPMILELELINCGGNNAGDEPFGVRVKAAHYI